MAFRLKSLYIKEYKNIKEQTFDFSSNTGYIALIGLNGSGKSNLLEAISIIFDKLINQQSDKIPFEFKVSYALGEHVYSITKEDVQKDGNQCNPNDAEYPSSLIACYSGEDLRLWHKAFEEYHMGYFNDAVKKVYSIPRLLYVNKYCWKIAFIALVCSNNQTIKDFLSSSLHISYPSEVELEFNFQDNKKEIFTKHAALTWFNRITSEGAQVNLNRVATTDVEIEARVMAEAEKARYIFNFLYLLTQPQKNEKNRIDKLIDDIKISVNHDNKSINFDDLSEGEKKLILIECITKVLGDENALILLDEPDAHTHIARKKELLNAIESFEGQIIMTTHSPVFIGMIKDFDNNIYPIEDGKQTSKNKKDLIGQISNDEISYIDGAYISSSKNILVTEGPDDIKYIKAAIDYWVKKDNKYRPLLLIPFLMQGGAKMVEEINNTILSKFEDDKQVVFLFDYDAEGRDGAKMVEKLKKANIQYCYYFNSYPIPNNSLDFYLEDFFDDSVYSEVQIPQINGKAKYYEMKKLGSLADSVKGKIKKNFEKNKILNFDGFKPLLDNLLEIFNLDK